MRQVGDIKVLYSSRDSHLFSVDNLPQLTWEHIRDETSIYSYDLGMGRDKYDSALAYLSQHDQQSTEQSEKQPVNDAEQIKIPSRSWRLRLQGKEGQYSC